MVEHSAERILLYLPFSAFIPVDFSDPAEQVIFPLHTTLVSWER